MFKNKRYFNIFIVLILLLSLTSCVKHTKSGINRTLLVYLAANNNISNYAEDNLSDLVNKGYVPDFFSEGGAGDVLLVYLHYSNQTPKLIRLSKNKYGDVNQETIVEYDTHNSVDVSTMKSILDYAYQLFPGKENGLILWSHGTGWLPKYYYSNPTSSSSMFSSSEGLPGGEEPDSYDYLVKSFGSDAGEEIDIFDLAKALPVKYSYIIYDACLMGGIEVAYEMRDKADFQIFSPAEILATGFPYSVLARTLLGSSASLSERLTVLCDDFYNFYNDRSSEVSKSATVSLVRSYELESLALKAKVIMNRDTSNIKNLNMLEVQRYFRHDKHYFYDFEDFVSQISTDLSELEEFREQLSNTVIYKKSTPYFMKGSKYGFEIKKYSGLSTYIPNPENSILDAYYQNLAWNKAVEMIK